MSVRLELRFEDEKSLDEALRQDLLHGRAFVPGATGLEVFMPCELALHRPEGGEPLVVGATVVAPLEAQAEERGVRLMLDEGASALLEAWGAGSVTDADADSGSDSGSDAGADTEADSGADPARPSLSPAARLKELTMTEQIKLARTSQSLTERTVLERMLDRTAWPELLRNPHVTVPEIARIARKGTVPRPLIELIVSNAQWTRDAIIRRALLSNPKLTSELVHKVLRMTPFHELKLVPKQTAYPQLVRTVAEKMLGR
jgi:hypothetical protein